jgi:integrase
MSKQQEMELLDTGIYRLANGQHKIDTTALDLRTGKMRRARKTCPAEWSLTQLRATRDQMQAELRGALPEAPPRLTLGAYAEAWIDRRSARLSPAAERSYRVALAVGIVPQLGDLYCDAIRRSDVEEWVAAIEQASYERGDEEIPYAQDTLRRWHRVLVTLCGDMAADLGIDDPTRRITPPRSLRRRVRETQTLSRDELGRLVEAAKDTDRYAEIVTLAYTGMRSGELWALRWTDLDGEMIHVRRTVSEGVIRDCTKTGWEREVWAPEIVRDALHTWRQELLRAQDRRLASELVFPSLQLTPRTCGSIRKAMDAAAAQAKITQHVSPQVLRRTFNTLMIAAGVNEIVLRSQMGHSDQPMTARYAGVRVESKRAAWESSFLRGG